MFLRKKPVVGLLSATDMHAKDVQHSDSGGGSTMRSRGEPYQSSHAGSQGGRVSFHGQENNGGSDRGLGSGRDRGNSERGGLGGGRGRGNSEREGRGRGNREREGRGRGNSEREGRGRGNSEREGRGRGNSERGGRGRGNSEGGGRGRGNSERGGRGRGNSEREGRGRGNSEREGRGRGNSERRGRGRGNSERGGLYGGLGKGNSERGGRERGNSESGDLYGGRGRENSERGLYGGRGRGGKGSNMVSDRGSYGSSQRQESDYNQGRDSYNGHQREVVSSRTNVQQKTKDYFTSPQRNEGGSYMDQQGRKGTYDDGRGPSINSRERGRPYRPGMGGGIALPDFPDRDKAFGQGKTSYMDSRDRVGSYKQGEGRGGSSFSDFKERDKSFSQGKSSYKDSRERVGPYEQGGAVGRYFPDFQRRDENANQSRASYMQKQNRVEPYKQRGRGGNLYMDSQRKRGFSQDESTYRLMGSTSSMDYENIRSDPFLDRPRGEISSSMDRERGGNRTFMDSRVRGNTSFLDQERGGNRTFMDSHIGSNAPYMDPSRKVNMPFMDSQRGHNAPLMDPQRGLNAPLMDPQRGLNAPLMDPQRGFNAPVMDSQREVNTPFMDQQRGVDTPFMGQERSGRREEPVSSGLSREEKQIALGILEQIIVKKKESDASQRRQQERELSSSHERHQEWEPPSSHERHQEWETPSSHERHQEWETPSSREHHQEWEPPSSHERHQEWEPPSSYERHQEWESPSSHEQHQVFEPYLSQMVNVQSQIQVGDLDSLERAAELSDKINDLVANRQFKFKAPAHRRFKAALQLGNKLKQVGEKSLTNAAKKSLTMAAQLSNVKYRIGKPNIEVAQLTNVKDRIGKRVLEMPEDYDYEDFAPPNKIARSSVLSRLGPKINTEVPMEVYGPDLRNLEQDQLDNLLGSLQYHDLKLPAKVLHCDLCAPLKYNNRTYPKIANYIRHHFSNEHIQLEESYKNKIKATLKYLSIEAKLGYIRRHGYWDSSRKVELCNLCYVPKGKGQKTHMKVTECWMYHEYIHSKKCCSDGCFNSRIEYFYHCFTIAHLRNEAHYREAERKSVNTQKMKMEAAMKAISEGATPDREGNFVLHFRDSLVAKEVEIYGRFGSTPVPRAVEELLKLYASNKDKSRQKRTNAPYIKGNEIQYKCYDPSVLTGRYKIIFATQFECSVCDKELGRSKQCVIDHCASQEHYDSSFDKINELREEKGLEPFTKKEPTSSQKEDKNKDEEESTNSQEEEDNNMDVNDDPCTEENEEEEEEDNMVDVDDDLLYTRRGHHMVIKDVCWKSLMERWEASNVQYHNNKNTQRKQNRRSKKKTSKTQQDDGDDIRVENVEEDE